ncbi:MAG TPA: thiosulfate oxidation carrier protein SoxY [Gallionella sp.]|nr:thiosulfate oxidation carrier protein SoxY [Gallionella sp.]
MQADRRQFLKHCCVLLAAGCCSLLRPVSAWASDWNKTGFEARNLADVLKSLNAGTPADSKSILLKVPDIADQDSDVPILISSRIPNTQTISIVVEGNLHPLAATFAFSSGIEPTVSTHLKIRKTSSVKVVVQANGTYHWVSRQVKVATAEKCG